MEELKDAIAKLEKDKAQIEKSIIALKSKEMWEKVKILESLHLHKDWLKIDNQLNILLEVEQAINDNNNESN